MAVEERVSRSEGEQSGMSARLSDMRSDMNARFDQMRSEMNARFDDLRSDMNFRFNILFGLQIAILGLLVAVLLRS